MIAPGFLPTLTDFVSKRIRDITSRNVDIRTHWSTSHDNKRATLDYFDIIDKTDPEQAKPLTEEDIYKVYANLPDDDRRS